MVGCDDKIHSLSGIKHRYRLRQDEEQAACCLAGNEPNESGRLRRQRQLSVSATTKTLIGRDQLIEPTGYDELLSIFARSMSQLRGDLIVTTATTTKRFDARGA